MWEAMREKLHRHGWLHWLVESHKARRDSIVKLCEDADSRGQVAVRCFFVSPARPGGAGMTSLAKRADAWSSNATTWHKYEGDTAPTGRIGPSCCAVVFKSLEVVPHGVLDLWAFERYGSPSESVQFSQGACMQVAQAVQHPTNVISSTAKAASRYRTIVAVGTLASPYAVLLRLPDSLAGETTTSSCKKRPSSATGENLEMKLSKRRIA